MTDAAAVVQQVRSWVAGAERITVLTGAGISTESGIPDFRGPNGVWTRNPGAARQFTLQNYLADPQVRRLSWRNRAAHPAWTAEPNAGHHALLDLERSGRLRALVTQNIDELHQRAGSSPSLVIEVHGTLFDAVCLTCARRTPMRDELARVHAGEDDPCCSATGCGGVLKSATISFGQSLVPDVLAAARVAAGDCDLFLAIGTSLTVQPVSGLPRLALAAGARLVVVNAEPTPYDDAADAVLREPIGRVLPRLVRSAAA